MSNPVQRMPIEAPVWATDAGVTFQPTLSERQAGWSEDDEPPARWQNDFQRKVFQLCDILQEQLLKEWSPGNTVTPGATADINALGWHNGFYLCEAGGNLYRSYDCRTWELLVSSPTVGNVGSIASDGSRIVLGAVGSSSAFFSDDDGVTWNACTGPTDDSIIFYIPEAGVWIGSDNGTIGGSMVSTDGETFVATSVTGTTYFRLWYNAENSDGTQVVLSDPSIFSVNNGTSWVATTNDISFEGYIYSELRGTFIAWKDNAGDTDFYEMSATAGTWESVKFVTLAGHLVDGMFELRGMLFALAVSGTGSAAINLLLLSRDAGLTWETATTLGNEVSTNIMRPTHPTTGDTPGISSEYAAINVGPKALCPPFAGIDFAAALA